MKSSFSDFFPVPAFLEMRPAGLAISERAVHVVEFIRRPQGLMIGRFGTREIPEGAISEGYVHDKAVVTEILSSLQKELSIEFVNASLPEEKAYLFKTSLPKAGVTDFHQTIELRLEENVPISAAEAIFDYSVIPESSDTDHVDVSVSVLPRKVVDTYLEIIKAAGFKPISFGVQPVAVSRAVVPAGNLGTFLVVDVGETSTSLSVVSKGVVQLNISVPVGGASFTSALSKQFSVDTATARRMKEERGFVKNKENMELFFSLMNTVSAIKDEVNKLFIYWQTHQSHPDSADGKIEKIILCGKDSNLIGFDEYLSSAVKIPVEMGNVWRNVFSSDSVVPSITFLDSFGYAGAIGLALPEKIK